jgi:hypothetical protein
MSEYVPYEIENNCENISSEHVESNQQLMFEPNIEDLIKHDGLLLAENFRDCRIVNAKRLFYILTLDKCYLERVKKTEGFIGLFNDNKYIVFDGFDIRKKFEDKITEFRNNRLIHINNEIKYENYWFKEKLNSIT